MSVTITRTAWIDDDGTGTTGTVINNAVKTDLYNQIDGALAKVAQLNGGNALVGAQGITGDLTVAGSGSFIGPGAQLTIRNMSSAVNAAGLIYLGNDADPTLTILQSLSSTFSAGLGSYAVPNETLLYGGGAGGIAFAAGHAAGSVRFYSGGTAERMRITPTGEVLVNAITNPNVGQLHVATDGAGHQGITILNTNPSNSINFVMFSNSAGNPAGNIAQTGPTSIIYGTASDARLKAEATRATDVGLRGLVVYDFTWKQGGTRDRGVFAQEASVLFPRAVLAGTDDLTESGDLARPWMTDYSKFVPDLIVGWQQHDAALAELRAALATLKG